MLDQNNFSKPLVSWFQLERSHLPVPARGSNDPYEIWIAEVMLQQTQISTVWPYFKKWLATFPTVAVLADASEDSILKLWEGLGYYSRARNLHKGAKFVMDELQGQIPQSIESLQQIPGIGPYTSAAIASFAFGKAIPLIDGNVLRVLSRVNAISDDVGKSKTKSKILMRLESLIPSDKPGAFNQGLMDLGRVICTPKNPGCPNCPVVEVCTAYKQSDTEKYPVKAKKQPLPHYEIVVGLIQRNNQTLIQKRPSKGLLGGLWEFPGGKVESNESHTQALVREIKEETGLDVNIGQPIGTIRHAYTHFKITLSAWFCEWTNGEAQIHAATENQWISLDKIDQFAFPKANLKIVEIIKAHNPEE